MAVIRTFLDEFSISGNFLFSTRQIHSWSGCRGGSVCAKVDPCCRYMDYKWIQVWTVTILTFWLQNRDR